jgi:hypothetical protein
MRRPSLTLMFGDGGTVERQPVRAEIRHSEMNHEIVVFSIDAFSVDTKRYQSGVPVQLQWGDGPTTMQVFYGYVSHVEPEFNGGGLSTMQTSYKRIYCVGASYVFKDGGYLGFKDVTAGTVVRRIASDFRFSPGLIQENPRTFGTLAQSGRSNWEFLADLAGKLGYVVYARGTDLAFHDRLSAVVKFQGAVPIYGKDGSTITKFESSVGKTTPTGGDLANRSVAGINPRTGQQLVGQQLSSAQRPLLGQEGLSALFTRGETGVPVDSLAEAQEHLTAVSTANQLPVTAKLVGEGNPRVKVGGVLFVDGLDHVNNGLWYVTGVRHIFEGVSNYTTEAAVGRDGLVASTQLPATGTSAGPQRGSRLVNGQWVTA